MRSDLPLLGKNDIRIPRPHWSGAQRSGSAPKAKKHPVRLRSLAGRRGRSAMGIKGDRLALYCTRDGSGAARTPEQLREDLHAAGWDSAVMLDGGGSSQCDFAGKKIVSFRKVQHLILVYLKRGRRIRTERRQAYGRD